MVWTLIKRQLGVLRSANADALFEVIFQVWEEIPQDVMDSLCVSFPARGQVCVELSESSLNGH
jgi:hypothetical protein